MLTIKKKVFVVFLSLSSLFCYSQHIIKGKIKFADKNTLTKYDIMVLQNSDSQNPDRECHLSKEDFSLNANEVPTSTLVAAESYQDTSVLVARSATGDPNINKSTSQIVLSEVVVKGITPVFSNRKNKMEMQVANTTLSEAGTATDILQKAPKVKVDENYGIYVGIDEATIYLNGRQVPSTKSLEMMSSKDIEKVEIITNPSVKYDSNARTIIDVIRRTGSTDTSKKLEIDIAGRMTKGEYWKKYIQTDVRANVSKFSIYGAISFSPEKKLYNEVYSRDAEIYNIDMYIINDIDNKYNTKTNNKAILGTEYRINDEHTLGVEGNIQSQKGDKNSYTIRYQYPEENSVLRDDTIISEGYSGYDHINRTGNLYHTYKNKSGYYQKTIVDINDFRSNISQETNYVKNRNKSSQKLVSARTDIYAPIGSKLKMETGAKFQYRHNKNEYNQYESDNLAQELHNYNYDDKTAALYVLFTLPIDKLKLQAGTRIEYVKNKTDAQNNSETNKYLFTQDTSQWTIVPNISLNYTLNDKMSMEMFYSQNIERPSFSKLNPSKDYIDLWFYQTGNPALRNERRHNFSLKYNYEDKSLEFNYIRRNNAIAWTMVQDPENASVTKSTHQNLNRAEIFSIDAVIPYRSDPFNAFVSTGIIHAKTDINSDNLPKEQTLWYATANIDVNLPFDIKFNTNQRYFTKGLMYIFNFKPSYRADLSLKRSFLDKKLTAVFMWNDIFKTDKMKTYSTMNDKRISYNYSYDQSIVSLSLTYSLSF